MDEAEGDGQATATKDTSTVIYDEDHDVRKLDQLEELNDRCMKGCCSNDWNYLE